MRFWSGNFFTHKLFFLMMMTLLLLMGQPLETIALNGEVEIIDACIGVDHPPFLQDYSGDGYSYLRVGITVPLTYYDPDSNFTGQLEGSGNDVTQEATLNDLGQLFFLFPLYAYGDYSLSIYDSAGAIVYQEPVVVVASEPDCNPEDLAVSPPKESIVEATETTEVVTEAEETREVTSKEESSREEATLVATEPSTDNEAPVNVNEDGIKWWPLILVVLGLPLITIGLLRLLKKTCEKERQAWLKALEAAKAARDASRDAENGLEAITGEGEKLEEDLDEIREVYPSAGKSGSEEAWVEMDGRRISSRDVALRREAERAAWNKYRSNPGGESAEKLQEEWQEVGKPQSEEERRELDKKAEELDGSIKALKKDEKAAQDKVKAAKAAEKVADAAEEAARLIYQACMQAALTPPKPKEDPKPEPDPEPESTPGSTPGVVDGPSEGGTEEEEEEKPCCQEDDPPQERNRRNLGRVSVPIRIEVNIQGGQAHKSAMEAKDISDDLKDISDKLGWISKAMDLKGVGEAIVKDGTKWGITKAGAPPVAGQLSGMPTPTSPGQLVVDTLSKLAEISSVIIGKVPELQARRLPDCDLRISTHYNYYKAECVEIWVCNKGQWVKDRSRFTLTLVGKSKGNKPLRRALTWARAQRFIRRAELMQRAKLARALDRLAELEKGCQ